MRALLVTVLAFLAGCTAPATAVVAAEPAAEPPKAAEVYRRDLIRNARAVWGLGAPVAVFGAQVHQESAWNPTARSKYADGLAQFTPATAEWIAGVYGELAGADPFNPAWALRALVRYDRFLYERVSGASECDRWAFTLAAYNGGLGWIDRDRRLAAEHGADPERWWGHVENYSPRAAWAFEENRGYPRRILLVLQPRYARWGPGVACPGVAV